MEGSLNVTNKGVIGQMDPRSDFRYGMRPRHAKVRQGLSVSSWDSDDPGIERWAFHDSKAQAPCSPPLATSHHLVPPPPLS